MTGKVEDGSVALVVTSPPYFVGKEYEKETTRQSWVQNIYDVFSECYRVLIEGGRICVNVANTGRTPYRHLTGFIAQALENCLFELRGEIIWDKHQLQGNSTAWGSWKSASNPVLRDRHEYIIVASKGSYKRLEKGESTITRDEFLEYTQSIWQMRPESAKRIGHPAPFPLELPMRLIKLYSYLGDVVLDSWMGSGTSCLAALMTGRQYIGFDVVKEYCDLAARRLDEYTQARNSDSM
jgi:modification methylase